MLTLWNFKNNLKISILQVYKIDNQNNLNSVLKYLPLLDCLVLEDFSKIEDSWYEFVFETLLCRALNIFVFYVFDQTPPKTSPNPKQWGCLTINVTLNIHNRKSLTYLRTYKIYDNDKIIPIERW